MTREISCKYCGTIAMESFLCPECGRIAEESTSDMNKREEVVKSMISTALHIKYENSNANSKDEILKEAISLKNALDSLYPVTDKQWQNILADIGSYADCLI